MFSLDDLPASCALLGSTTSVLWRVVTIAPIKSIEPIRCVNRAGEVVRQCYDVTLQDKYGTYLVPDVPLEVGSKLKVGALFNAPIEIGLDNSADGGEL